MESNGLRGAPFDFLTNTRLLDMDIETVVLPADDEYPLQITANCYKPTARSLRDSGNNVVVKVTLILTHAMSVHKETWEPMLQHLFSTKMQHNSFDIIEAWAIEAPNHGSSASLNEEILIIKHQEECA